MARDHDGTGIAAEGVLELRCEGERQVVRRLVEQEHVRRARHDERERHATLLGVLAGTQAVDSGTVHRRKGLRVQLLQQDVRFADPDASPRRLYERVLGARRAEQVPLSTLGLIAPRDADRPVGTLSVGQQRRLALALVIARPPHVFLLDEPTNHLSLGLATDLEAALGSYPGAVVIASHDRWLRRRWTEERLQLAAGRLVSTPVSA